jgi:hypothetical protein
MVTSIDRQGQREKKSSWTGQAKTTTTLSPQLVEEEDFGGAHQIPVNQQKMRISDVLKNNMDSVLKNNVDFIGCFHDDQINTGVLFHT